MKQKELNKEGITKEFLNSFSMTNNYSPVQLRPGEEPVKLMECAKGYWVVLDFGKYLKDEHGKMIIIPEKEAKIGRARYMLNFADVIADSKMKAAIEKEHKNLLDVLKNRVRNIIVSIKEVLIIAEKIEPTGWDKMTLSIKKGNYNADSEEEINLRKEAYERKKQKCVELATDSLVEYYNTLCELEKGEDWDSLYIHLFQDNVPLIFKAEKNDDLTVLKDMFSASAVEETIDKLKNKGHLWVIAEIKAREKLQKG